MLPNFLDREPGQGKAERMRKFAGQSLNLNDEAGGKAGFTPASRLRLKARESSQSESLTPLADDLPGRVQPSGDDIVGQALIG
jgi:hypothetical protein